MSVLTPLGTLARAGIEIDDYINFKSNQSEATRLAKWISMNSNSLIELKNLYGGLTIVASADQTAHSAQFIPVLKKLQIKVGPTAFDVAGLKTLISIVPILSKLGYQADIVDDDLGEDFINCAKLFMNASSKIANLKSKITDIKLGGYTSDFYSGHLIIGQKSTPAELDKVLNMIK